MLLLDTCISNWGKIGSLLNMMAQKVQQQKQDCQSMCSPLHHNISMHILHSISYTFPKWSTRRSCVASKASSVGDHFYFLRGDIGETRDWSLLGVNVLLTDGLMN